MSTINPCPFCGSKAVEAGQTVPWWVTCEDCGADGPTAATEAACIDAWNAAPRQPAREWSGPDRWQVYSACDNDQPTAPPDEGFEPIGAWKLIGVGPTNLRVNGGPEDMDTVRVWRRPLRALPGEVSGG